MDKDSQNGVIKKTEIENEKKVGNILTKFQLMETQILNQRNRQDRTAQATARTNRGTARSGFLMDSVFC